MWSDQATNPIIPVKQMMLAVIKEDISRARVLTREVSMPRLFAVSSPPENMIQIPGEANQ